MSKPAGPIKTGLITSAVLAVGLGACSQRPIFETDPILQANPNVAAPLAAVLTFTGGSPATVLIDVTDGDNSWRLEYGPDHDPS